MLFLDPGSEIQEPGLDKNKDPGSGINILRPGHVATSSWLLIGSFWKYLFLIILWCPSKEEEEKPACSAVRVSFDDTMPMEAR